MQIPGTLAERLVADLPREVDDRARVKAALYHARHFALDREAVSFATQLLEDHRPLLEELREFALPPFDRMAVSSVQTMTGSAPIETLTLWDRGEWKLFLQRADGSSFTSLPGWTRAAGDGVANDHPSVDGQPRAIESALTHHRFLECVFLLLAQPRAYQVNFTESRTAVRGGKRVRFMAQSDIRLALSNVREFRKGFYDGSRGAPRRHEVRRHFTHRGGDRAHVHQWEPLDLEDGKKRWLCACGRRRAERGPFERGDAAKGFVQQKWSVTA